MKALGIFLLLFGLSVTILAGFQIAKLKKASSFNSVTISKERAPIYWVPATGSILIVAGIVITIAGKLTKQNS